MKKCERCELNYMADDEELCDVCFDEISNFRTSNNSNIIKNRRDNIKNSKLLQEKPPVTMSEINNGVNAAQVFRAVMSLLGEYIDNDDMKEIYSLEEYSYRQIINKLKSLVKYAELRIGASRHLSEYRFDGDEVFEKFFMNDPELIKGIKHRRIRNIFDLLDY